MAHLSLHILQCGVPQDLPKMPVRVLEVPAVNAERAVVRAGRHRCTSLFRGRNQGVDFVPALNCVSDAEQARTR